MRYVYTATEDRLSEAVALRLIRDCGEQLCVGPCIGRKGKQYLRSKLRDFAVLARNEPVLLITDLDNDSCPADLRKGWFGQVSIPEEFLFRVAVREIEAWVMADRRGFSRFSGAPLSQIPSDPEALPDPKAQLLKLVRRYSSRELKQAMIVNRGSGRFRQGFSYNEALSEFVQGRWNPVRASATAPSLAKARQRVHELAHNTP